MTFPSTLQLASDAQGGICRHLVDLARGLEGAGGSVRILAPRRTLDRVVELGMPISVERLDLPSAPLSPLKPIWAARSLRSHVQPGELIHAHGYKAAVSAAASGVRPFVMTAHNMPATRGRRLVRAALAASAQIIAVSEAVAEKLERMGVARSQIRVIPNAMELPSIPTDEARRTAIDQLCNLTGIELRPDEPLVMGIGRLSPEKGFDILIEAHALLRCRGVRSTLVLVGGGRDRFRLDQLARALGSERVFFAGQVPDARSLAPAADILVAPSREEGQSLAVLEGLAFGIKTVATDTGGISSMIRPQQTGWLTPAGDVEALAGAVQEAIETPGNPYREAGRRLIETRFKPRQTLENLIDVYRQAKGQSGRCVSS